jgi:putative phosphoribosyl transferase
MMFENRADAGRRLATQLGNYANRNDVIVLGIPRGGVPVAFEIAMALNAPLDVFVSRKLGVPWQEELAFGAVASGGVRVLDSEVVGGVGISDSEIERVTATARMEVERRERAYRNDRPPLELEGRTVILVDDGIATGSSMSAAISALRELKLARLVIAVPVAPESTCNRLEREVDQLVCVLMPESFSGIGEFYDDFSQLADAEVTELLRRAERLSTRRDGMAEPFMPKKKGDL